MERPKFIKCQHDIFEDDCSIQSIIKVIEENKIKIDVGNWDTKPDGMCPDGMCSVCNKKFFYGIFN